LWRCMEETLIHFILNPFCLSVCIHVALRYMAHHIHTLRITYLLGTGGSRL
jgi:hypothetical protein